MFPFLQRVRNVGECLLGVRKKGEIKCFNSNESLQNLEASSRTVFSYGVFTLRAATPIPAQMPMKSRTATLGPISKVMSVMILIQSNNGNKFKKHLIGINISVKWGEVPICGIGITIGIGVSSVETVLHTIIKPDSIGIGIEIGIGIGVGPRKHTISHLLYIHFDTNPDDIIAIVVSEHLHYTNPIVTIKIAMAPCKLNSTLELRTPTEGHECTVNHLLDSIHQ